MPHLRLAVKSTLGALPHDSNLVIHDDASEDGTSDYLDSLDDARVRVMTTETPRGVAGGLNHLLDSIDSEFVGRMDADDIALPWRFQQQLRTLRAGADVTFTTTVLFGSTNRPRSPLRLSSKAVPFHLLIRNPFAHSTMCARTESITRVSGYRAVPAEDYDLWMRLAASSAKLVRIATPGILYRVHHGQVTAQETWRREAHSNPGYADSYESLAATVLGASPTWFRALRRLDDESDQERLEHLRELSNRIDRASSHLGPYDRSLLRAEQRRHLLA